MGTRRRRVAAGAAAAVLLVAAPAAARPLMTKSEAVKLADAINLTADDVPDGYKASGPSNTNGEDLWGGKRFARCSGRKGFGRALADRTATFEHQTDTSYSAIGSEVMVMPNARLAKRDFAIVKSPRGRKCLLAEIRATKFPGVRLVSARISSLSPGVTGGFAIRLTVVFEAQGIREVTYSDVFAMARKNVEAVVSVAGVSDPPQRSDEDKYIDIVQTRLDTALNPNTIL